ncbi:MAG TPA: hypothetical protein GXZ58_03455 [Bacilli bacterium]|nr:hypothetical protein [Bacilli bacterium]
MTKRNLFLVGIISLLFLMIGCSNETSGQSQPDKIRLDYAHYSPTSLVLKEFGWVEEAFEEERPRSRTSAQSAHYKARILDRLNLNRKAI